MTQRNISHTNRVLEQRAETSQIQIDGDTTGAIFRTIVDADSVEEFTEWVTSDLDDISVEQTKYVGFGVEVTLE